MLRRKRLVTRYNLAQVIYKCKESNGNVTEENDFCKNKNMVMLNEAKKDVLYLDTGTVIYVIGSLRLYSKFDTGDFIVVKEILKEDKFGNIINFFAIPDEKE